MAKNSRHHECFDTLMAGHLLYLARMLCWHLSAITVRHLKEFTMAKYGHLFYTKIYERDLELFITHDVSKHAQRLYIFFSLQHNTYNELTDHLNDQEIAEQLETHRTTIMRARAELEDAGLIVQDTDSINAQKYRYHLPHKAKIDRKAARKREENKQAEEKNRAQADMKKREKAYAKKRAEIETHLKRRLAHSEIQNLRERFELS